VSEHTPPEGPGQPSPEQMQAALSQLRGTPVTEVVLDILQGLLSAAQVKIGRRDGRLLLDLAATLNDQVAGHVDAQLTDQVKQALTQLRMAQVEAEQELAASGEAEPNDLDGARGAPSSGTESPPQPPADSPASRLWIPGR